MAASVSVRPPRRRHRRRDAERVEHLPNLGGAALLFRAADVEELIEAVAVHDQARVQVSVAIPFCVVFVSAGAAKAAGSVTANDGG